MSNNPLDNCVSIESSSKFKPATLLDIIGLQRPVMPYRWDEDRPPSAWEETVDPAEHWKRKLQEARAKDLLGK